MEPSLKDGIAYWEKQEANINGVLGGHGYGPLPRVDSLGSRQFLMSILPKLCTVPSALRPLNAPEPSRTRALDVGAGVGRVTSDVLLHLCTDVVTLEPVESLIQKAISDASTWKGIGLPHSATSPKSVTFIRKPLQHFDPSAPLQPPDILAHMGISTEGLPTGYDVIWCQWCLGHLNNEELVLFLQQSRRSLREGGVIVVKENCCPDSSVGGPFMAFDEEDSSLMRSDKAWLHLFASTGLTVLKHEVQLGFPAGLFVVKSYALT